MSKSFPAFHYDTPCHTASCTIQVNNNLLCDKGVDIKATISEVIDSGSPNHRIGVAVEMMA